MSALREAVVEIVEVALAPAQVKALRPFCEGRHESGAGLRSIR